VKTPRNDREAHAALYAALDTRIEPSHLPHCGDQPNDAQLDAAIARREAELRQGWTEILPEAEPASSATEASWRRAHRCVYLVGVLGAMVLVMFPGAPK
jgi:hypothetical protein